jgi:hypothetical protein
MLIVHRLRFQKGNQNQLTDQLSIILIKHKTNVLQNATYDPEQVSGLVLTV